MWRWEKLKKPAWQILCVRVLGVGEKGWQGTAYPTQKGLISASRGRRGKHRLACSSIPRLCSCPDGAQTAQGALAGAGHLGHLQVGPQTGQRSVTALHSVLHWEGGLLCRGFMRLQGAVPGEWVSSPSDVPGQKKFGSNLYNKIVSSPFAGKRGTKTEGIKN